MPPLSKSDERSELRQIREELRGLHGSLSQFLYGKDLLAPGFVFTELTPVSEEEIKQKADALRTECGLDYESRLKQSGRYSELYFLHYFGTEEGTNTGVLDSKRQHALKLAIQCEQRHTAFHELLFKIYQRDFRGRHKESVEAFQRSCGAAELVILHVSCRARAQQAQISAETFEDSRIRNVIVVGHGSEKAGTYSFTPANGLLIVPACDAYEALAEKTAAAYAFLAFSGSRACVLKVDDDIRCLNPGRLTEEALPLVLTRDYVGRVWHTKYGFWRSWHFGKCQEPTLNDKPYGLLADASYAEGPDYLLGPRAVQLLGKASVYLEQLFETERGYEDLAMGKVLNHYGILPTNYDLIKAEILSSVDPWMMKRAGLPRSECD